METNHLPDKAGYSIAMLSNEKLLSVYGPANCLKHAGKLPDITTAMNTTAPTLAAISREKGRGFSQALVMGWLVYLNDLLNLNKPMTEDQIDLCAQEVITLYPSLKMSDLTYLFRRIIAGQYGEFYESLSIPKVLSFFRDYFEERCLAAADESRRRHDDFMCRGEFNVSNNLRRKWNNG